MTSISPLPLPPSSPQPTTTAAAAAAAAEAVSRPSSRIRTGVASCSLLLKAGVALNVAAFLVIWLSVLAPYWLVNELLKFHLGILYGCRDTHCTTSDALSWQVALAVLEVCGLAFGFPSFILSLRFVLAPVTSGKKWVKVATGLLTSAAALFILIGIIVCAAKKDDIPLITFDLGWAFGIAVVAGILYVSSAVFFFLDTISED